MLPSTESAETEVSNILRDLNRLSDGGEPALAQFRARMRGLMGSVWRRVAQGDLRAPQETAVALTRAESFITEYLPEDIDARAVTAIELESFIEALTVGANVVSATLAEQRIADPKLSELEQQILLVLLENVSEYQRRGQVLQRLQERFGCTRTAPWIGQKLEELLHAGLLTCIHKTAQGHANTGFYALSDEGERFAKSLEPTAVWDPWSVGAYPGASESGHSANIISFCTQRVYPDLGRLTLHRAETWFNQNFQHFEEGCWSLLPDHDAPPPRPKSVLMLDLDPDRVTIAPNHDIYSLIQLARDWEKQAPHERLGWLARVLTPDSNSLYCLRRENSRSLSFLGLCAPSTSAPSLRPLLEATAHRWCMDAFHAGPVRSFLGQLRRTLELTWEYVVVRAPPQPMDALLYLATVVLPHAVVGDSESDDDFVASITRARGQDTMAANVRSIVRLAFPAQRDLAVGFRQPPGLRQETFEIALQDPQYMVTRIRQRLRLADEEGKVPITAT